MAGWARCTTDGILRRRLARDIAMIEGHISRAFDGALATLHVRVIEMGDASREALRSLAAGRVVALLGDQQAHRGGVMIPFFGRSDNTGSTSILKPSASENLKRCPIVASNNTTSIIAK